ncbi:succinate-semialdehyde dehydrogenase/glutarate-semialdehyde dehydrogenase [Natronospira proteinivora]|uniref:Succinate-semialdehyde dehydrogenase/glutarate-semialdehyde dehydrogenase n=1 Tax=Natronospira proteinivora TaxID=1807133 RepID=A0ABT1G5E1_9GAMM|nr:aldehyde dehydrogenase family protein [Natronospira proteinivora]MCP1726500.1 succinate-semialdehyde dehydrogenase/glutarate-semialdehyde dehydrogenase [Natronospira proteinivora]
MDSKVSETETEAVVFNPSDGSVLSRHPWMTQPAVDKAFAAARAAQPEWAALTARERSRRIRPLSAWLAREQENLARIISSCNGKPLQDAIATEILPGADAIRYYARMAPRWLAESKPALSNPAYLGKRTRIHHVPHGLVGIIVPWNYPLGIPLHEISAALLAGNAVIFKTAPETVPVGEALSRGVAELDLPEGLFQHLILPGSAAGEALLDDRHGVDKLCFTGSVPVGRLLAREAGDRLIPMSAELGGKDPMIVCDDAPLARSVNGALWGSLQNSGQACAGIERIYVQDKIHDDFVSALAEKVSRIRVGRPDDPDVDLGPMSTAQQRDKVQGQLDAAVAQGARIMAQSPLSSQLPENGFWFPATLVTDVDDDMALMREETFGPIIAVQKVSSLEEAISQANHGPFALTASIWTGKRRRGRQLAQRLKAGTVTLNDHLMSHGMPEISWGGPGQSGLGRTHGYSGFMSMSREQNVVDERLIMAQRAPWWFPYSERARQGLAGAVTGFHGQGPITRIKGLGRFLRLLPSLFQRS